MNNKYKRRYEQYKALGRWVNDGIGLFKQIHLTNKFEPKYHAELTQLHKAIFPRRNKINLQNIPTELVTPIQEKWVNMATNYNNRCVLLYKLMVDWLDENGQNVELLKTEELQVVKSISVDTYRSQGWGKHLYVKAKLEEDYKLLVKFNFDAEIVLENKNEWNEMYVLYANCEPYIVDALKRQDTTNLMTWATNCWRRGVNPKIYYPFLSHETFEKSMYMANK